MIGVLTMFEEDELRPLFSSVLDNGYTLHLNENGIESEFYLSPELLRDMLIKLNNDLSNKYGYLCSFDGEDMFIIAPAPENETDDKRISIKIGYDFFGDEYKIDNSLRFTKEELLIIFYVIDKVKSLTISLALKNKSYKLLK